jgi:hypothetical protein
MLPHAFFIYFKNQKGLKLNIFILVASEALESGTITSYLIEIVLIYFYGAGEEVDNVRNFQIKNISITPAGFCVWF